MRSTKGLDADRFSGVVTTMDKVWLMGKLTPSIADGTATEKLSCCDAPGAIIWPGSGESRVMVARGVPSTAASVIVIGCVPVLVTWASRLAFAPRQVSRSDTCTTSRRIGTCGSITFRRLQAALLSRLVSVCPAGTVVTLCTCVQMVWLPAGAGAGPVYRVTTT